MDTTPTEHTPSPGLSRFEIPIPDLLWQACDGMMIIDEGRRVLAMNPTLQRWVGSAVSEADCGALLGCRDLHGNSIASRPLACPGLRAMRTHEAVNAAEFSIRSSDGQRRVVSASYTPLQHPSGTLYTLVVLRDITQSKRREASLAQRAMLDPLTGLYNRAALTEISDRELKRAQRTHQPCAAALIDVDGLKAFNDAYGHAAGDEVLKALARIFRIGHRGGEVLARYGGDEFALLLPDTDTAGAVACGERIRQAVERFPFHRTRAPLKQQSAPAKDIPVTISVGISVFPADGATPQALFAAADYRLYRGKHAGKNRVVGPIPPVEQRQHPRVTLEAAMVIRRQEDAVGVPSHEAAITNISIGGAFAVVSDWPGLKNEDPVFFSIRIPQQYEDQFPLSHLIGTGRIQRLAPLNRMDGLNRMGISVVFGDEMVMVAAAKP